jgi:predicted RNA binding protein YcfA (HicA-like mRNA interferase family)
MLVAAERSHYSERATTHIRRPLRVAAAFPVPDRLFLCIITHLNSAEIVRKLESEGWRKVHQAGRPIKFKHPEKPGAVTVPHPKKDLPIGTLRSIYRQAGWQWR